MAAVLRVFKIQGGAPSVDVVPLYRSAGVIEHHSFMVRSTFDSGNPDKLLLGLHRLL